MKDRETCQVNIYDRTFTITCPEEGKAALFESATYLDRKMRNMASNTKVMGLDQLAVITALNIIHTFFNKKESQEISKKDTRLENLCHEIELALNAHE